MNNKSANDSPHRRRLLPVSNAEMKPPKSERLHNLVVVGLCMVSFMAGSIMTSMKPLTAHDEAFITHVHVGEQPDSLTEPGHVRRKYKSTGGVERGRRELYESKYKKQNDGSQKKQQFPSSLRNFIVGMSRVSRDAFAQAFAMGVPIQKTEAGQEEVIIMYEGTDALPNQQHTTKDGIMPQLTLEEATANCDVVHVVLTKPSTKKQCMALVPQYQSFHVQNWMRLAKENITLSGRDEKSPPVGKLDSDLPLRMVGRGYKTDGINEFKPPFDTSSKTHWKMLENYFGSLERVTKELKPLTKKIARDNTVVVMVCNHGQSELLMNFVCAAKSRGINIDHVLLFATDIETFELAEGMGLNVFHDDRIFGSAPTKAAERYGDGTFGSMMMAKVYCVHLISVLGYDLLFQDVDVVWYRDPVPFFKEESSKEDFDMYFQEDGGLSVRYAPYSANSGFYYVKNTMKTRHFFSSLLLAGDGVLASRSHQQHMIAVLAEHVSLYGLRAKVMSKDSHEFPGGFHYHARGDFMKKFMKDEIQPLAFHMSWTENKSNKLFYLKQMGDWFVEEQCVGKTADELDDGEDNNLTQKCCSAEPLISCHYRDKPSKIPCNDSPLMDGGRRPPFWSEGQVLKSR